MSSKRKIDSARANGAKSHGPKSEAGRRISAQNAVSHGLYSASVVLSRESRVEFQTLLDSYLNQFQPDGQAEFDLVEEMAAAKWRQRRLWAIETDLLEDEIISQKAKLDENEETYDEITTLSFAYRELSSKALSFLTRHESRLERAYSRALKNLLELQKLRKNSQERTQSQFRPSPNPPSPNPSPDTETAAPSVSEVTNQPGPQPPET